MKRVTRPAVRRDTIPWIGGVHFSGECQALNGPLANPWVKKVSVEEALGIVMTVCRDVRAAPKR